MAARACVGTAYTIEFDKQVGIVRRGMRMCAQKAQSTGGTHLLGYTVDENKKYIGTYEYNGEVYIENAVPPMLDVETFNKVQELLKYNQAAAAHKKAKVDYLLTEKLFCGKCGTMMVGVCGYGL